MPVQRVWISKEGLFAQTDQNQVLFKFTANDSKSSHTEKLLSLFFDSVLPFSPDNLYWMLQN